MMNFFSGSVGPFFKITNNTSNFITGVYSIIYKYDDDGGNTADLSNQIITIGTGQGTISTIVTLTDINGDFQSVNAIINSFGQSIIDTRRFTDVIITNISSMRIDITSGVLPSPGTNFILNSPLKSIFIEPSGGGTGFIENGVLENTCGY